MLFVVAPPPAARRPCDGSVAFTKAASICTKCWTHSLAQTSPWPVWPMARGAVTNSTSVCAHGAAQRYDRRIARGLGVAGSSAAAVVYSECDVVGSALHAEEDAATVARVLIEEELKLVHRDREGVDTGEAVPSIVRRGGKSTHR